MTIFATHKAHILKLTKGSIINLQVAKDKAGVKIISTVQDCEAVLKVLTKKAKITPPIPPWVKERYNEAHKLWVQRTAPGYYKAGYSKPVFPKIHTGNGLNTFIENFITWCGFRATRINVSGRKIGDKYIKSSTRPGSADVSSTIKGDSVQWETKIGNDKPSERQLREQQREQAAGGQYYFVKTAEQFLNIFDGIVYG